MSILRRIKKNIEKNELKQATGKTPEHKCPKCKKMSLWKKDNLGKLVCIRCGK